MLTRCRAVSQWRSHGEHEENVHPASLIMGLCRSDGREEKEAVQEQVRRQTRPLFFYLNPQMCEICSKKKLLGTFWRFPSLILHHGFCCWTATGNLCPQTSDQLCPSTLYSWLRCCQNNVNKCFVIMSIYHGDTAFKHPRCRGQAVRLF